MLRLDVVQTDSSEYRLDSDANLMLVMIEFFGI